MRNSNSENTTDLTRRGFVSGTASAVGAVSLAGAVGLVSNSALAAEHPAATSPAPLSDFEIIEVTGQVTDQYGNPRAGAQIEIWHKHLSHWLDAGTVREASAGSNPVGSTNHWYGCHTDADGNYAFCTFWPRKTAAMPQMTDDLLFLQVETEDGARTVVPKQISAAKARMLPSGVPSFEVNFLGRNALNSELS